MVDTAVGFPKSREEMYEFYEFIRKGSHDTATRRYGEGGLEFPAGYMFKDVPEVGRRRHRATRSRCCSPSSTQQRHHAGDRHVEDEIGQRAVRELPDRFFPSIRIDPNEGMEAVRKIDRYADEFDLQVPSARSPPGSYPQVALNDKKFYPIYAKCIELDVAFCSTAGVPGPRSALRAAGRRPTSTRCAGSSPSSSS